MIELLCKADKEELERKIANMGLTDDQINALDGMFKIMAYTEDPTAAYNAFKAAFTLSGSGDSGGSESGGEDSGEETEKTLTSISATYFGDDVSVGTAVTDLTGIMVNATYSDGSTETVTGYTLSGTIAEGENIVTVSYGGLTTTFTVTGVAEYGGTPVTNYSVLTGYYYNQNGKFTNNSGWNVAYFEVSAGETYTVTAYSGKAAPAVALVNSGYAGETTDRSALDKVNEHTDAFGTYTTSYTVPQNGCLLINYSATSSPTIVKE